MVRSEARNCFLERSKPIQTFTRKRRPRNTALCRRRPDLRACLRICLLESVFGYPPRIAESPVERARKLLRFSAQPVP
jgi:hypothetical protein